MTSQPSGTSPPPNFDRVARTYRWLEYASFGRLLERCRFAQLPHLANAQSALVLGDGDGRFLARLLALNPGLQADAIDSSAAMLALARARTRNADGLHFQQADIRSYEPLPERRYDLIVTHFFLDCLTEAEIVRLVDRLAPAFSANTTWIVSEFAVPAKGAARPIARVLIGLLYRAFRLLTGLRVQQMPRYAPILGAAGFACERETCLLAGILSSQLWRRQQCIQAGQV